MPATAASAGWHPDMGEGRSCASAGGACPCMSGNRDRERTAASFTWSANPPGLDPLWSRRPTSAWCQERRSERHPDQFLRWRNYYGPGLLMLKTHYCFYRPNASCGAKNRQKAEGWTWIPAEAQMQGRSRARGGLVLGIACLSIGIVMGGVSISTQTTTPPSTGLPLRTCPRRPRLNLRLS
jgi:hypothetical protein